MTRTATKAICDVLPGEFIGDRIVRHVNRCDRYVTVDFGDSEPLVRQWYHKVVVTLWEEK